MKSNSEPEVLVVGAGPVGLYTALLLAKNGVRVEIIDKESRRSGRSYALALHGRSMELLDEAGLGETIRQNGNPVDKMLLFDGKKQRANADLNQLDAGPANLFVIRQNQLETLLESALKQEGVEVDWRHRLDHIERKDNAVSVKIDKLKLDAMGYSVPHFEWVVGHTHRETLPCVVGADGYMSLVRRSLPVQFRQAGRTEYFAVFEFKSNIDFHDEVRIVFDEKTTSVLWPLSDGHLRWSFQLLDYKADEESREKDRDTYEIVGDSQFPALTDDHLHELIEERAPWFKGTIDEMEWRMVVRFERRLASSFGRDQVCLAGDAAHLTGPVGMQSMNAGLIEASLLSQAICEGLRGGVLAKRLKSYQKERLAEWHFLLGQRGGLKPQTGANPWIAKNVDRLLSCLPATGEHLESIARDLKLECVM